MTIGSSARRLLGPRLERVAADCYRRMFVDLDALAATIAGLGSFTTVIEVGCGEGALLARLMNAIDPDATALGIDIAPNPGHGYTGRNRNVEFRQAAVAKVVADGLRFDLVVVSDVLHHIPPVDRRDFLESCRELLTPKPLFLLINEAAERLGLDALDHPADERQPVDGFGRRGRRTGAAAKRQLLARLGERTLVTFYFALQRLDAIEHFVRRGAEQRCRRADNLTVRFGVRKNRIGIKQ